MPATTAAVVDKATPVLDSAAGLLWAESLIALGVPQRHLLRLHPAIDDESWQTDSVPRDLRMASRRIWNALERGASIDAATREERPLFAGVVYARAARGSDTWAMRVGGVA